MRARHRTLPKQSNTSAHYQKQLKRITFFLERSCGGKTVLHELRKAGLRIEPHSRWFKHNTPDEVWLRQVGEKKWVVLMRDQKIGKRLLQLNALLTSGVKAFVLVTGDLPS